MVRRRERENRVYVKNNNVYGTLKLLLALNGVIKKYPREIYMYFSKFVSNDIQSMHITTQNWPEISVIS